MVRAGILGKKMRRGDQDFYLQITSLIDTLVIILVFMLMTIGSGSINLEVAEGVKLPWVSQGADLAQGLKLIAKKDGVYIEETKVAPLVGGVTVASTMSEENHKIVPLFQKLAAMARENKKLASAASNSSGVKFEGKILFQADKDVPLKTVKQVMYTAARAGYNDFKFAVIRQ